jgi:diguanylate cyclase (GGDEF)-like protein/PAS domain S-box-containing protein
VGARILVLDDEESILEILGHHLNEVGHHTFLNQYPAEALARLENERFDLLITDLKMPSIHGIEVVQRAKALDPKMAVVVVTAMMDVTNAIEALRAGADDYLLKPFNLVEITISVNRVLERRRLLLEIDQHHIELEKRVNEATAELQAKNEELHRTKTYLENLLNSSVDAIVTVDTDGHITFANPGTATMLGHKDTELNARPISDILVGGQDEVAYIQGMVGIDTPLQNYETELIHASGAHVPVNVSLSVVLDSEGKVATVLAICKDITAQKRLEAELKEATVKDALTSLYNHGYFFDRLDSEIERARRQGHPLSLMLFDIDEFKSYNDRHGHLEGDRVLRTVGQVIRQCTREHVDLGFRYGGDEYTVILPEAEEKEALVIAERIRRVFASHRFDQLTLSIGLMQFQPGISARSFIRYTDSMMYKAKRSGGNKVCVFERHQIDSADEREESDS